MTIPETQINQFIVRIVSRNITIDGWSYPIVPRIGDEVIVEGVSHRVERVTWAHQKEPQWTEPSYGGPMFLPPAAQTFTHKLVVEVYVGRTEVEV